MFIYILNLLNDALNRDNLIKLPAFEVINDTTYISKLAGIKRNFDYSNFSERIIIIFEIFNKYKLNLTEGMGLIVKIILNDKNSWILERLYGGSYSYEFERAKLDLCFIINNILENQKKLERYFMIDSIAL